MPKRAFFVAFFVAAQTVSFHAAVPIHYTFTFPEPQHRWMQVEATFSDLASAPIELRMSRSSPGRYSLHDFAKNVWDVHAFTRDGHELPTTRPDPYGWNVSGHGGAFTLKYKIFGDTIDGTYLSISDQHAHVNMPAAIMWARGLDDRPLTLTFVEPSGQQWKVATQLHPGSTPLEFTAPNLQYLMDSPAEFGPGAMREFDVDGSHFRFAAHHAGTDAELDSYVKDVEKIVQQEERIYGEFPKYEPGYYTFLADYLPYAGGDGMEHRNSTVMTSRGSIKDRRAGLLGTVAHEFFHCWNVERIRPRSLEPFDFERANMSGELWLAEGFTQYYGPLAMTRAGVQDVASEGRTLAGMIEEITVWGPGREWRTAEEMSRMAPFTDGGQTNDRTNWPNTVISYYGYGGAIALALDLSLRDKTDGKVTLDDYMRAMWRVHGKPGGLREGYVDHPYTIVDAQTRLAEVSGDRTFARDFFNKYIQGHDVADYGRLLAKAGLTLRKSSAGAAWLGEVRLEPRGANVAIAGLVPSNSPAYEAGLEQDDVLQQVDGQKVSKTEDVQSIVGKHQPGDRIAVAYLDRSGASKTANVTLVENAHQEIVPVESAGGTLTPAQQAFRNAWLGAK